MATFHYIAHTADKGIEVWADTADELFAVSAEALFGLMVDISAHSPTSSRQVDETAVDRESLFVKWLSDLLFHFDSEQQLPVTFHIESLTNTHLVASVEWLPVDVETFQPLGALVKAITYHGLVVEERPEGWFAHFFVDV